MSRYFKSYGVLAATLLLASQAGAQVIYSNGNLSTGATSESGVAAPAGFSWSEVQHNAGNLTESNNTLGFGGTQGSNRLADDFTVPAGTGWTVASVNLYSYQTSVTGPPSPFTAYTLQIWGPCAAGLRPDDLGCTTIAFGDTTTNRMASTTDSTLLRTSNSLVPPPGSVPGTTRRIYRNNVTVGTTLAPGIYWLDWASTVTGAGAHFDPPSTVLGSRGGGNGRQFAFAGATWADAIDLGNPGTAPDVIQDFPFELLGTTPVDLVNFSID